MTKILILSPFRNEEHSIPQYLAAIKKLRHPPELVDLYWLENDSSDNTLEMLKEAQPNMPFNSTTLESMTLHGPVKKRKPGGYIKDVGYGPARCKSWLFIWNEYFTPLIRKSDADYVLCWWADAIPPRNVVKYYLFDSKDVAKCKMTGHVWMMPREAVAQCRFYRKGRDMHMSLVLGMKKLGLQSYFTPKVFIHHISNDGKVWSPDEDP